MSDYNLKKANIDDELIIGVVEAPRVKYWDFSLVQFQKFMKTYELLGDETSKIQIAFYPSIDKKAAALVIKGENQKKAFVLAGLKRTKLSSVWLKKLKVD